MCTTFKSRQRRQICLVIAQVVLFIVTVILLDPFKPDSYLKYYRQRYINGGDDPTGMVEQPRLAVTSSLWSDHPQYTRYIIALGDSMIKSNGAYFTAAGVDMILLTYSDVKFSPGSLTAVERVGWKMRQVSRISPTPSTPEHYKENYGRINIWAWTEYSRIVYIDADTIVMGDISALFLLPPREIGVVGDVWENYLDEDHFNAGVLSLEPNMDDFVDLIADYRNYTVYQNEGQAEQGLLKWYFKDRRTMLPRTYNFNLQLCNNHKAVWNELKGDARIVHYTTYKPGDSRADDLRYLEDPGTEPIMEPMTWWWDVYEGSDAAREWNGTFVE